MHRFRYRPINELVCKELLYNELYFASPEELNDPFDGQSYFTFPKDSERWARILNQVWGSITTITSTLDVDEFAETLANYCPVSYQEVLTKNFQKKIEDDLKKSINSNDIATYLSDRILQYIERYKPSGINVVSFSRIGDEPLMWSHYAGKHTGFCLIFKPYDGRLFQDRSIEIKTKLRTCSIGESFPFFPVEYCHHRLKLEPETAEASGSGIQSGVGSFFS